MKRIDVQRIAIIGNAGGGKSRLARHLGDAFELPVFSVDDVQFQPGWLSTPLEAVADIHSEWLKEPRWVIDGWGAWELIERRFDLADLIVIIDFSLPIHYWWALKRQIAAVVGRSRGWPPLGCRAFPVTLQLIKTMQRVHRESRPLLLALAEQPKFVDRVVHLQSPAEWRQFRQRAIGAL